MALDCGHRVNLTENQKRVLVAARFCPGCDEPLIATAVMDMPGGLCSCCQETWVIFGGEVKMWVEG